jgi:hypothetical protein
MRLSIGALTGDGKTTLGCQMIRSLVTGEPFLDWTPEQPGRALIVDVEQGEETVKQRLRDLGLADSPAVDILWEPDGLALDSSREDRRYVEDALRAGRYDAALFDPLYQLHCGDENSERTAADVMKLLDGWARDFELGMIIPMHRRKPQFNRKMTINEIGGHGAWVRNSEIVFGLDMRYPGRSQLYFFKDRPGFLPGVGTRWDLDFNTRTHLFRRAEAEEETGWEITKRHLQAEPGLTTRQLAERVGIGVYAVHDHLKRKIGAHCESTSLRVADRRWSLEPWPEIQPSLLEGLEIE